MPSWPAACRLLLALFVLAVGSVATRVARAGEPCASGNLLAGATPAPPAILVDGAIAAEGSPFPDAATVVALHGPSTWDLGEAVPVGQIYLQVDADEPVDLATSLDGEHWTTLSIPPDANASGMLGRAIGVLQRARFVRLSTPHPSGTLAVTEVIVTCDPRDRDWAHDLRIAGRAPPEPPSSSVLAPETVDAVKLLVAVGTIAALVLSRLRRRDGVLVGLAVVALAAYTSFGAFRYPRYLHEHDVFHYYVGAKYFPELGYDGLYDCATAAEAEAGFVARIDLRSQRDLRTNALVKGAEIRARARDCRARFTDERWRSFADDISWFASGRDVDDWHRVLRDHGFNASPTWIALAAPIARHLSPSAVAPLDPILLALAFGAIAWAFDRRIAALAVIAFATNPLSDFAWLGGAFLRQLWLAALVIGVALVAKKHAVAAGVALALAALLQIFPAACLASLAVGVAVAWWKERRLEPFARRLFVAAAITFAVAAPLSSWGSGRAGVWHAFVENTEKHARTPSANLVGLKTALSFRPSTRAERLFDEDAVDPFARVRAARAENYGPFRIVHWLGVATALAAIVWAARRRPPEEVMAALGVGLVPVVVETSSYYTSWIVVAMLCARERPRMALPFLAAIAAWLVARLAGSESDSYHAIASVILVAATGAFLWLAAKKAAPP